LKRIALVLCACLALGTRAVVVAQGFTATTQTAAGSAVGTVKLADETTLSLGDAAAQAKTAKNAAGSSTLAYFLRMIVVLALVLAAIYGVYRLMKKASRPKDAESSAIKLLASSSLGPGKSMHIVGLGSKAYLVGATDSSINLVAEIEDKEFLDGLVLEASTSKPKSKSGVDFSEMLAGLLGGKRKSGNKTSRGPGDFLAGQRERLRKF
jgi:flagellar protein FliO/FliZ